MATMPGKASCANPSPEVSLHSSKFLSLSGPVEAGGFSSAARFTPRPAFQMNKTIIALKAPANSSSWDTQGTRDRHLVRLDRSIGNGAMILSTGSATECGFCLIYMFFFSFLASLDSALLGAMLTAWGRFLTIGGKLFINAPVRL